VFDYIVFRVDRGTVYLAGYGFEGRLKADLEMAAKRASGVDEVADKIEVLPTAERRSNPLGDLLPDLHG
jgi:hypothetical protein